VAGRALAFSDDEIVQMATRDFVPVAGDDWYQRRRQDDEGRFFRAIADQGPRKGAGGSTRQGIYCLTAGGRLLAYKNAGHNPQVMRETLRQALREWSKLPAAERAPGAVKVGPPGAVDPQYARTPPPGGLILKVYTRALERDDNHGYAPAACAVGRGNQPARDHLWLTQAEWRSLAPSNPKRGDTRPLPAAIASRILRFHLVDNTRGEPPMWRREDIRASDLTLTVEQVNAGGMLLRLDGRALLMTDPDETRAERGYDARLSGWLQYDAARQAFVRFDIVAVGEHWGEGRYTRGARAGRAPLAVAFELATGERPADRVPPQAARDAGGYFGRH
jgi:hypothetical protein